MSEQISMLHTRAAHWFAAQGLIDEAIQHYLAAGLDTLAADLVEVAGRNRLARGEMVTLCSWLAALPPIQRDQRPNLLLLQTWTRYGITSQQLWLRY